VNTVVLELALELATVRPAVELGQASQARLDRARVTVVAPIVGTGVLWTVVFAAAFLGRSELIGRRLVVVALLVVAGSTLVGATR
jgi:uncharacterized membrane protein